MNINLCPLVAKQGANVMQDRQPGGEWYCFDDTNVEPWDPAKLDMDCFGGRFIPEGFTQECDRPNSAYMLFYERADGAQPMAVSPAPPIKQQSSQQMPDVEMPAQQGDVAVAVAHPAAETRTPFNMPPSLYEAVLFGNLRQLGAMQLLSVSKISTHMMLCDWLQTGVKVGSLLKRSIFEHCLLLCITILCADGVLPLCVAGDPPPE